MPRPSLTEEEKKKRRRLSEQKRKRRIKSDPVLREEFLKKDRERYAKRKAAGSIIARKDMTPRRRRILQKKNLASALAYYKRKKGSILVNLIDNAESDEISVDSESTHVSTEVPLVQKLPQVPPQEVPEVRKILRPRRVSSLRSSHGIHTFVANSSKFVTSSPQATPPGSPQSTPNESSIQSPESIMCPDSPASDSSIATINFKRQMNTKFRKYQQSKYSQINALQNEINKISRERDAYKKRLHRLIQKPKEKTKIVQKQTPANNKSNQNRNRQIVVNFYEDDENSSLCPGKNDTVTRNGAKKQKRLMTDTMKNLHKKYLNSGYPPISYVTFSRMRPFWVQQPNINMRNTCLCEKHENMDLIIGALKSNRIIKENTTTEVLRRICCDIYNLKCLLRTCSVCKDKHLDYQEFDNSEYVHYCAWEKQKNTYKKNDVERTAYNVDKMRRRVKPRELIKIFETNLSPFLKHCANISNQSDAIRTLKQNLTENDCVVHIDFSENYGAKYNSEIQSLHFGGSRKQFTLHTAVLYFKSENDNEVTKTQCFCTISTSERHDAAAVWAHFVPILREIENTAPQVKNLYIISDSPTSQYRNKKIFYLMTQLASYIPTLNCVVWNYCECGHGKGAPDGVGGLLKRTADRFVSQKGDIPDIHSLITSLKSSVQGVKIETVEDHEVIEKDWLLPENLKAFQGTMQVHQVIWTKESGNHLALRLLSCTDPECINNVSECSHGKHLGYYDIPKSNEDQTTTVNMPQPSASHTTTTPKDSKSIKNVIDSLRPVKLTDKLTLHPKPSSSASKQNTLTFLDKNLRPNYADSDSDDSNIPSCSFFEKVDSPMLMEFESPDTFKIKQIKAKTKEVVALSDTGSDVSTHIFEIKSRRKLTFIAESDSEDELFSVKSKQRVTYIKQSDSDD